MTWSRAFDAPIPLPDGDEITTLREGRRIRHGPAREGARQAAFGARCRASKASAVLSDRGCRRDGAPLMSQDMMGRRCLHGMAVPRALNRHDERVFDTSRKAHHCGKRKLARDRTGYWAPRHPRGRVRRPFVGRGSAWRRLRSRAHRLARGARQRPFFVKLGSFAKNFWT
jgi:hypothetical protein